MCGPTSKNELVWFSPASDVPCVVGGQGLPGSDPLLSFWRDDRCVSSGLFVSKQRVWFSRALAILTYICVSQSMNHLLCLGWVC